MSRRSVAFWLVDDVHIVEMNGYRAFGNFLCWFLCRIKIETERVNVRDAQRLPATCLVGATRRSATGTRNVNILIKVDCALKVLPMERRCPRHEANIAGSWFLRPLREPTAGVAKRNRVLSGLILSDLILFLS